MTIISWTNDCSLFTYTVPAVTAAVAMRSTSPTLDRAITAVVLSTLLPLLLGITDAEKGLVLSTELERGGDDDMVRRDR